MISSLIRDWYNVIQTPRETRGGGLAFMHRKQFSVKMDTSFKFSSIECLTVLMDSSSYTFRFLVVYRIPPSPKNNNQKSIFMTEFGDLVEQSSTLSEKLVILGDFNVYMDSSRDSESAQLSTLFESFGLVQHVHGCMHISGYTLDLIVARTIDDLIDECEVGDFISDRNSIHTSLKSAKPYPIKKKITYRKSKAIEQEKFIDDIQSSHLLHLSPSHVDDMITCYNKVLPELLDKHATLRTQTIAIRSPQPWINKRILEAKRTRRSAE